MYVLLRRMVDNRASSDDMRALKRYPTLKREIVTAAYRALGEQGGKKKICWQSPLQVPLPGFFWQPAQAVPAVACMGCSSLGGQSVFVCH